MQKLLRIAAMLILASMPARAGVFSALWDSNEGPCGPPPSYWPVTPEFAAWLGRHLIYPNGTPMHRDDLNGVNTALTIAYAAPASKLSFEDDIFAPLARLTPDDPIPTARYDLSGPAWDEWLSCRGLTRDGFAAFLARTMHDAVWNNVQSQRTGGVYG
jgi:hypothetical protein